MALGAWCEGFLEVCNCLFTLITELSDKAQLITEPTELKLITRFTYWRHKETNLHKWSRFPHEFCLTQTMFARSPNRYELMPFFGVGVNRVFVCLDNEPMPT